MCKYEYREQKISNSHCNGNWRFLNDPYQKDYFTFSLLKDIFEKKETFQNIPSLIGDGLRNDKKIFILELKSSRDKNVTTSNFLTKALGPLITSLKEILKIDGWKPNIFIINKNYDNTVKNITVEGIELSIFFEMWNKNIIQKQTMINGTDLEELISNYIDNELKYLSWKLYNYIDKISLDKQFSSIDKAWENFFNSKDDESKFLKICFFNDQKENLRKRSNEKNKREMFIIKEFEVLENKITTNHVDQIFIEKILSSINIENIKKQKIWKKTWFSYERDRINLILNEVNTKKWKVNKYFLCEENVYNIVESFIEWKEEYNDY